MGPVFADPLGIPLNPMALTRAFQSLAKQQGLNGVRLHDLRHFHASVLFGLEESPVLVSKRLGHANVSTTARYDRRGEKVKHAAAQLLEIP